MAIRDKFRKNAQPHLEPGETIHAVFGAQTHSGWFLALTGVLPALFILKYVSVIVTDRRILLGKASPFAVTKFSEILAVLPRQTVIGPPQGLWYKTESLGRRLYIHKRFHGDITEADSMISQPRMPAPPPPAS
jgi:hypothetical protein